VKKQVSKTANHNRSAFLAYGLLILLVVVIAIGGISAKYFKEIDEDNGTVSAKDFYFESDWLDELNPEYSLTAGTTSVTFSLYNFIDGMNWAEETIHYTVTVEGGNAKFANSETTETGDLEKGKQSSKEFTLSNLENGETYVVTATSGNVVDGKKTGYVKTLKATFTVNTDAHAYMNLSTSGPQVILTVWTENVTGKVSFKIPRGLIPNETESPELSGVSNYSAVADGDGYHYGSCDEFTDNSSFNVYTSKAYYFIKEKSTDTYTYADFFVNFGEDKGIKVGEVMAEEATP